MTARRPFSQLSALSSQLLWILLASQLSALSSQLLGAELYGQFLNANSTPYTNEVLFRALSTPLNANPRIIAGGDFRVTPNTNGDFTINLQAGDYRVFSRLDSRGFVISVPDGTNSYLINSRITSALTYTPAAMVLGNVTNVPAAATATRGTVKTDTSVADPVVYLKATVDTLLDAKMSTVETVSDMLNLTPGPAKEVYVRGLLEPGDRGGGSWMWDPTSTKATNAFDYGIIRAAPGYSVGRWIRQWDGKNAAPEWWGAFPADGVDDYAALQAAVETLKSRGGGNLGGSLGLFELSAPVLLSDAYGVSISFPNAPSAKNLTNSFVLAPLGTNLFRGLIVISNTSSVYSGQGNLIEGVYFWGRDTPINSIEARTNRIAKGGHGLVFDRASYSTVQNCTFARLNGDAIYVGDRGCSVLKILDNFIELNAGSGITAFTMNDSIIRGNAIGNNGVHQFSDETTGLTNGVVFSSSTSTITLTSGTWDTARFTTARPVSFYSPESTLNRNTWTVISVEGAVMTVSQAVADETFSPGAALYATPVDISYGILLAGNNNIVEGNHIYQTVGHNVGITIGRDNQVVFNRIDGSTRSNVALNSGTRNRVALNYCYDGGVWYTDLVERDGYARRFTEFASGVRIGPLASESIIEGNELYASYKSLGEELFQHEQHYSIYDRGKGSIVRGNKGWGNKGSGYFGDFPVSPKIEKNEFQYNVNYGIYLFGDTLIPARIKGNTLSYNGSGGVVLDDGASAMIEGNDLLHFSRFATTIRSNIVAIAGGQTVIYPAANVTNFTIGEPVMCLSDRGVWMNQFVFARDLTAQSLTLSGAWRGEIGAVVATAGRPLWTSQQASGVISTADAGPAWMIGNMVSLVPSPYSNLGTNTFVVIDSIEPAYSYLRNIRPAGLDIIGDSMTDGVNKARRIGMPHYLASEEPMGIIFGSSTGSSGVVNIGGGTGLENASTDINFWAATNNVTPTGTARMRIDANDNFYQTALTLRWNGADHRVAVTNVGGVEFLILSQ